MTAEALRLLFTTDAHNPSFAAIQAARPASVAPIDFCVPVNRHFPPPALIDEIREALPDLVKYYPDYADVHQRALATIADVPSENIVVANGSTELITLLCQQVRAPLATSIPTFGQWTDLPLRHRTPTCFLQRRREQAFALTVDEIVAHVRRHRVRTLVLSNPNNPTGAALSAAEIECLVTELSDLDTIIIDESFIDFSDMASSAPLALRASNLVIVKSLGKSLGWHGVRLGYAIASTNRAKRLRECLPYWNVNGLAAFVLQRVAALRSELRESFTLARQDRSRFVAALDRVQSLIVFPSQANFLYAELPEGVSGQWLRNTLLDQHALLVRECSNKQGSSERYLRLAVNRPAENERLVGALQSMLA